MGVRELCSDFAKRSGAHGFYDINRGDSWPKKSFWIFFVLIAWAAFTYQLVVFSIKYFKWPVKTTVELKFDTAAEFPSITICNLNPVKFSHISSEYNHEIAAHMDRSKKNTQNEQSMKSWDSTKIEHESYAAEGQNHDQMPYEVKVKKIFYQEYYKMPEESKWRSGHHIQDMLMECIWLQEQCYPENFTYFHHPTYGNCYSFNAGWERLTPMSSHVQEKKILRTNTIGKKGGLSLILFVEQKEYVPLLASQSGVRVHIHHQSQIPFPEDSGFTVSVGFSTNLEVQKTMVSRLGKPYNSQGCHSALTDTMTQMGARNFWHRANYSLDACIKLCYQAQLKEICDCIDAKVAAPTGLQPCVFNNTQQENCRNNVLDGVRKGTASNDCSTECQAACNDVAYKVRTTSSIWPNQYYLDFLQDTLASRSEDLQELFLTNDSRLIEENVLQVQVYYQRLNYESITESKAYILTDLLGDIGGSVGLWVGMSVLALVECFEFLMELFLLLCCHRKMAADPEGRKYKGRRRKH